MSSNVLNCVGSMKFGRYIDISDPCYDRDDISNFIDVSIREGEYNCYIAKGQKFYDMNRIAEIAIIIKSLDCDDVKYKWSPYGDKYIGVDSGLAGFFNRKIEYSNAGWSNFCDRLYDYGEDSEYYINFDNGFFSRSGWGDGGYEVEVVKDDKTNEIIAVKIIFIDDDYDDEEEDEDWEDYD